jgi:hypothetical protein
MDQGGTATDGAHKLFLIRRTRPAEAASPVSTSPITDTVAMRLAAAYRDLRRAEQVRMYKYSVGFSGTRALGGVMYEPYCQERFKTGIQIKYASMVRLPDTQGPPPKRMKRGYKSEESSNPKRPRWHTTHCPLSGPLETLRIDALKRQETLCVNPSAVIEYREPVLTMENIKEDIFYVPAATNQVALDSFVIHRGILFLFQFTVGRSHEIKGGFISFLQKGSGFPSLENVRLIFVIPGDVLMKTPVARSSELSKIQLYSAVFEVKN